MRIPPMRPGQIYAVRAIILSALLATLSHPSAAQQATAAPTINLFEPGKPYVPHKDVANTVRAAMAADFDVFRGICMTGNMIGVNKEIDARNLKRPAGQKTPNAPAGEKCVAILKQAATATLTGKITGITLEEQDIRYPYKQQAKELGFKESNANADTLLTIYSNAAINPPTKDLKTDTEVEFPNGIAPYRSALALDVGYTTCVTESQAAGKVSINRIIPTMQTLIANHEKCQKAELSYNTCFNVGRDLAATHLVKNGLLPATNADTNLDTPESR